MKEPIIGQDAKDHLLVASNMTGVSTSQLDADEKTAWIFAFGVLLVVATMGNSLVTWFIIARRRLAKAHSCFMLSLTIADFAMLYLEGIFNFIYILDGHWRFGTTYCMIDRFLSELTNAASIFTLTVTSYDRYLAIVKPFFPRSTRKRAVLTIFTCWIIAVTLATPNLLYSNEFISSGEDLTKCEIVWPEQDVILNNYSYRILVFLITYLLPSVSMAYWNFRIAVVLTTSTVLTVEDDGMRNNLQLSVLIKKRKNLAGGMWAILVIFCLCWLPYQTYLMYQAFQTEENVTTKRIYMSVYWLAIANAAVNPVLFYRLDKQYRECVRTFCKRISNCFETPA
ncbi:tachykinin-like peptides receptor 86C [Daphnia magna]|uniref:tachykinin-like peptides receptor 86C n=1 Tax=Daphnia magna TaxID=35525 RepID=UPI001E1BC19A|nr:tachykinin-like peptides receptor 86C [Daphnia magna]